MLVPPKKQTEPLTQKNDAPIPTRMQTRSMTAEKRRLDDEEKNRQKELQYYLGLETVNSRTKPLATPEERAEYKKKAAARSPTSIDKLKSMMYNLDTRTGVDPRTNDEVLHDFAVASQRFGKYG